MIVTPPADVCRRFWSLVASLERVRIIEHQNLGLDRLGDGFHPLLEHRRIPSGNLSAVSASLDTSFTVELALRALTVPPPRAILTEQKLVSCDKEATCTRRTDKPSGGWSLA
jgi:hypothetical protein